MNDLISGAISMAYFVAGLFFLRFWRRSKDRFFVFFAAAFWILAVQRVALALTADRLEDNVAFYAFRLVAFVVILAGIWDKNQSSKDGP